MRLLFILPGAGGGGGSHSVVQEAQGLQRLGAEVGLATTAATLEGFRANYPELVDGSVTVHPYEGPEDLAQVARTYQLAIATAWRSTHLLADVAARLGGQAPRLAYYVQDYEPLFNIPHSADWDACRASYTVLPEALLFAKTKWLCDVVRANHHRPVGKVSASIDHAVYHPGLRAGGKVVVSAMVRTPTPRRAPYRTARILEAIGGAFGDQVELIAFGSSEEEMSGAGIRLSPAIQDLGPLSRAGVADVLRRSDLFLDLSDYQAFGRTGLEGMACGCAPLLPLFGGADEYLRHWINGFVVDTRSDDEILQAVSGYISLSAGARERMRQAAIATALDYTVDKAAFSEYKLFKAHLG